MIEINIIKQIVCLSIFNLSNSERLTIFCELWIKLVDLTKAHKIFYLNNN